VTSANFLKESDFACTWEENKIRYKPVNALLIPIYEPSEKVLPFLYSFKKGEFDAFLVVDDGSGERYASIFKDVEEKTVFSVISYPTNKGKGFALKTGMTELLKRYPDLDEIVTADGDGQHIKEDIISVANAGKEHPSALILGVRDWSKAPPKSASGNKWSARYFRFATSRKITDCQTGLRAIPSDAFDMALATYGYRFDYEMNFLLPASREFGFIEVPIHTIYEEGNKGTHFRPVADSLLIMRTPIAYILVGVTSFLIDILTFWVFATYVWKEASTDAVQLLYCHLCSRAISLPYNYFMLEKLVFHHKGFFHNSFYKYFFLAVSSLFTGYFLTWAFRFLSSSLTWIKVVIDIILGIVKYLINLMITFANRKFGRKGKAHYSR